jgi:hypothetical protein
MSGIKISDLPEAPTALGSMDLEVNDSGTSRRVSVDKIKQFVGNGSGGGGAGSTFAYTRVTAVATTNQTIFPVSYAVGYVDVWLNGVKLDGSEFTAINGSSVVLAFGATAGASFEAIAWNAVETSIGGGTALVESNPSGISGASVVTNVVAISQADYDAITTPNSTTLYVITG